MLRAMTSPRGGAIHYYMENDRYAETFCGFGAGWDWRKADLLEEKQPACKACLRVMRILADKINEVLEANT